MYVCMCVFSVRLSLSVCMCVCVCVRARACLGCCANVCQNIIDSIHVRFNHLCSFLPMKCVYKCVDELHRISHNSYYILITQQRPEGASISSWGSSSTSFFF